MALNIKAGKLLQSLPLRVGAPLLTIALVAGLAASAAAQVDRPSLAIDVSPGDNEPTKPGEIENCIEVPAGYEFEIDLIIEDVEELLAWEIRVEYDMEVLEVVARDVKLFQQANPGSSVFDVSEALPDDDGMYGLAAADTSDPPTPDSGSGTLARLTLRALTSGESALNFARRDLDDDGDLDVGPFLRNIDGEIIGDSDGDSFFDGPVTGAIVAVETSCPPGLNSVTVSGSGDGGSSSTWIIIASAVAILAAATVAGTVFFYRRARSSPMTGSPGS